MTLPAEEYLGAFLDGYEFMLLAFEGRLDGDVPDDVEAFLDDYHRILELHRKHIEGEDDPDEVVLEEFPASLLPESQN